MVQWVDDVGVYADFDVLSLLVFCFGRSFIDICSCHVLHDDRCAVLMTGQSDHLLTAMSQSLWQHVMHISWIVITVWCCSVMMLSLTILFHFNVDYLTLKWRRSPFVVQLDSVSWSYIHLVLFCKLTFDWLLDGVLVFLVWWATTACDHHFNATLSIWERIAICCSLKFI